MEAREGPCPPERGEALRQERLEARRIAWVLGTMALGALAVVAGLHWASWKRPSLHTPGLAAMMLVFSSSMVQYARSKGQPALWGLLGLGLVFGWAILYFLPNRCGCCGAVGPRRAESCPVCSAPLGHRIPHDRPPGER